MKIAGGNQSVGQGKVLTSDSTGNATWQGAVAFNEGLILLNKGDVPPNTQYKVPYGQKHYDLQNNLADTGAGTTFIAPVHGIYHFDAQLVMPNRGAASAYNYIMRLYRVRGNYTQEDARNTREAPTSGVPVLSISKDLEVLAGDKLSVSIYQNSSGTQNNR